MARIARVVVPGLPHHVTQRGNRRQRIFFTDGDHHLYRRLLAEQTRKAGVEVWAYCLMPNHVHLIATPSDETGLGRAIGETHRRYTNFVNDRAQWTGHLFQGRFASTPMDEAHLIAAARYVALNPVRAHLVARAEDWRWSSAKAHLAGRDDGLVRVQPLLDRVPSVSDLLLPGEADAPEFAALRAAEMTGRPVGTADFIAHLERSLGRKLTRGRPGPQRKSYGDSILISSEISMLSP
jgi:putative transposase